MNLVIFSFVVFRILFSFVDYLSFISQPVKIVEARVMTQYHKKNYFVLKMKTKSLTFYTISRENLKNLLNRRVEVKIFTKNISFWGYLTKFFAPSYDLKLLPKDRVNLWIEKQHKKLVNLYKALFLGEAVDFDLRQKLATLGISHLVALSGLHLGFISLFLYFLFYPVYNFFHKFFPYRNRFFDLGVLVLGVEFFYLYFTYFPPSLIRAFVMEMVLFLVAFYLREILSIRVLILTFLISFYFFLFNIFTIGFFLSIAGVYYIFLFFKYFRATWQNSIILSFYMFLVMFVLGHFWFGNFNFYQLLSPIVNILFAFFYPLSIILHIFNLGGIFDNLIEKYLDLGKNFIIYRVGFEIFIPFLIISFLAWKEKRYFWIMNIFASLVLGGAFWKSLIV